MNNTVNIFSEYSGIFYTVDKAEYNLLDEGQIILKKMPKSCSKCYSRGYVGFCTKKYSYIPCSCVLKVVDVDCIKTKFNLKSTSV